MKPALLPGFNHRESRVSFGILLLVTAMAGPTALAQSINVLTEHNDISRDGANTNETTLTPADVNSSSFGKLFTDSADAQVYAQPLYVQGLSISGGTHNVVFVCTESNSVYAFDADTGGTTYWHVNLGTPFSPSCSDLVPVVGITGTPVIDLNNHTLYVDSQTVIGGVNSHKLHALDITTGNEEFGGPVTVSATLSGKTFNAQFQRQRPGLLLLNGVVYVGFGSFCDQNTYYGWLLGYNETSLSQVSSFIVTPSGTEGAIWQSGGGPAVDAAGNIYIMTGNGTFDGTANYGESFVKLNGSLSVLDFATPSDYATLNANDTDFGSGGPVCLPSGYVVGMGKDGTMYVANESSMGHLGGFAQSFSAESGGDTVGPVVYWNGPSKQYVFATHANSPTKSFQWNGASFTTTPLGTSSFSQSDRVGGASLSANGTSNGILWEVGSDSNLRAYDAVNFPTVLWSGSVGTYVKMNRPTIANGKVYVGTSSTVGVWGLLSTTPDFTISASPSSQSVAPGNGTSYTVTVTALNGFNGTVNLSASGLPSGASAGFNPSSITASGTSTMSVSTSSSTPTGTSTLTITGASASTNHTTTVSLVVLNLSVGAQPVSINFVGGGTDNTLGAAQSAGVVSEANWNNATGVSGSGLSLNDDIGALTTATLTWSANHTTTESLANTAPNYELMNGSINAIGGTTNTVTVSGLTNNANGWTVYAYCQESTGGGTRTAAYGISGSGITTTTIDATDPGLFGGTFTQADNSTGNYVVFTIGDVSGFTITSTPVSASDGTLRAPINGIQIIPISGGGPPQPPTGLSATPGNAQVALSWNASTGATSYNVKRSTSNGGPYTTITNVATTSYTDTGLSNGTTYYYVVSALNSNGESGNSSQVSATPGPPAPPTGLSATPGNAQVALSWNASTGATSYNVKDSTTNGGPYTTITNVTATSYTDTGLNNGTTYYFVVSALNSAGESGNSGQVSATPTSSTLLSQGHPATASTSQAGNAPANGNDGSFTTRWGASSAAYPQWWSVDLGATHNLTSANIYWFDAATRSYKYEIQVSSDNVNFTTVVNATNNVTDGNTTNTFSASDRYVRVYVSGASAGWASFYECQIFGN